MNHEQLKELIFLLPDADFQGPERAMAEEHLSLCGDCREASKSWEAARGAFFKPEAGKAPAGFTEAVMEKINQEPASLGDSLWRWFAPGFGLAAACALLALSFLPANGTVNTDDLLYNDNVTTGYDTVDEILNI